MDDVFSVVSLVFFILSSVSIFITAGIGVFEHVWTNIQPDNLRVGLKKPVLQSRLDNLVGAGSRDSPYSVVSGNIPASPHPTQIVRSSVQMPTR
ncbi:hypothetical protein IFM46972_11323 [Aspergillus udagawae]|uniref:Uncharacterized protein n=1 Tax=Aspergillus udagawae TaxID=91492 RepID=A0A8H3XRZ1_9EURO|nr:hypothetical protein IFM46972_11323 [Aspergillus udagawae]